jgi:hypothetical protein
MAVTRQSASHHIEGESSLLSPFHFSYPRTDLLWVVKTSWRSPIIDISLGLGLDTCQSIQIVLHDLHEIHPTSITTLRQDHDHFYLACFKCLDGRF